MSATSYPTTAHGVAIIIGLTPDVTDAEAFQFARDLAAGFKITLPTGVEVAFTGNSITQPYTVWPAKPTTNLSSLQDD